MPPIGQKPPLVPFLAPLLPTGCRSATLWRDRELASPHTAKIFQKTFASHCTEELSKPLQDPIGRKEEELECTTKRLETKIAYHQQKSFQQGLLVQADTFHEPITASFISLTLCIEGHIKGFRRILKLCCRNLQAWLSAASINCPLGHI